MLPDCLAIVRDGVDEMIIVDTGSTDRTSRSPSRSAPRCCTSRGTARSPTPATPASTRATGDWILWLDADERLEDGDADAACAS